MHSDQRSLITGKPDLITLAIPAGEIGKYRVAQHDDYSSLKRKNFIHYPPLSLTLRARVSEKNLAGTWGFGLWNDPFSLGMGIKGSGLRLPALPQSAWFFYGSPKNDLSFHSQFPANGWMASVFRSKSISSFLFPLGMLVLPFLMTKSTARWIRRQASRFIQDDFIRLDIDVTAWHTYRLDWLPNRVGFYLDGISVFTSPLSPNPPLGLVMWIDNQYAAFSADGTVSFGTESNPAASLEIKDLAIISNFKP
jgi:hypothetical protein